MYASTKLTPEQLEAQRKLKILHEEIVAKAREAAALQDLCNPEAHNAILVIAGHTDIDSPVIMGLRPMEYDQILLAAAPVLELILINLFKDNPLVAATISRALPKPLNSN